MRCRWSLGLAILVLLLHRSRAWLGHDWFGSSIGDEDDVAALWARSNASASELAVAEKNATDLKAAAMSSAERARDAEASVGRSWVVQQVLGSTSTQSPPCLLMMMIDWLMGTAPSVLFSQARALDRAGSPPSDGELAALRDEAAQQREAAAEARFTASAAAVTLRPNLARLLSQLRILGCLVTCMAHQTGNGTDGLGTSGGGAGC